MIPNLIKELEDAVSSVQFLSPSMRAELTKRVDTLKQLVGADHTALVQASEYFTGSTDGSKLVFGDRR